MALQNETLEQLFDRWNTLQASQPGSNERIALSQISLYTLNDPDYASTHYSDPEYFQRWRDQLPPYYQQKADVMFAILTRLNARQPIGWIVSEIKEEIPQLAYFLFVRHLQRRVMADPLEHRKLALDDPRRTKPTWLSSMLQKGVTVDEIQMLAQEAAQNTLGAFFAVTDGYGAYGDLPANAPRPRVVEAFFEDGRQARLLDGLHEYMEDPVYTDVNTASGET